MLALCSGCSALSDGRGDAAGASDATGTLFVANKRGASLSRIDLRSGEETHRADTCENPHELAISPDQELVMLACYSGTTLEIYRTENLSPAYSVDLGEDARVHSAVWHSDGRVIAGAEGRGSLFEIEGGENGDAQLTEIGGGGVGPHMVAVNAEGTTAWGTLIPAGSVVKYDLASDSEIARSIVGEQTEALALSPDGESLWVGSNTSNTVYRLDANSLDVVAQVDVGLVPIRIAAHPDGQFVATSNFGSGDISVIDTSTNSVDRTITVSGAQDAVQVTLAFNEDGSRLYAAETADNVIAEIDFASGEVLRRLPTGPGGDGLAIID